MWKLMLGFLILMVVAMMHNSNIDIFDIIDFIYYLTPKGKAKKAEIEEKAKKEKEVLENAKKQRKLTYDNIYYSHSKVITAYQNSYRTEILAFNETDKVMDYYILGGTDSKEIVKNKTSIPFSKITGVEMIKKNTCEVNGTSENSSGNALKRAAVGGILAGGAGAVVGAMTSKNHTSSVSYSKSESIKSVIIYLSDISNPTLEFEMSEYNHKTPYVLYATIKAVLAENENI